jgi:hypothetical protein
MTKTVSAEMESMGKALSTLASSESGPKPGEDGEAWEARYDRAINECLIRHGNRLRATVMSEGDADSLISQVAGYDKLVVQGSFCEGIPWELLYGAGARAFLGGVTMVCRPIAHVRDNEFARAECAEGVPVLPMKWVVHEDVAEWVKSAPWTKDGSGMHTAKTLRDLGELGELLGVGMDGRSLMVICHMCECDGEGESEHGAGLDRGAEVRSRKQRLELSKTLSIEMVDIPLLGIPEGAIVFLLACTTRPDGAALELARRYNATVIGSSSVLPVHDAKRIATVVVNALKSRAGQTLELAEFLRGVQEQDGLRRGLLTVHGRSHINLEIRVDK